MEKEKVRAGEREEQRKNRVGFGGFFLSSLALRSAAAVLTVGEEEEEGG